MSEIVLGIVDDYKKLLNQLLEERKASDFSDARESELCDQMDTLWYAMSAHDQDIIEGWIPVA
jgi:hypothetical protein